MNCFGVPANALQARVGVGISLVSLNIAVWLMCEKFSISAQYHKSSPLGALVPVRYNNYILGCSSIFGHFKIYLLSPSSTVARYCQNACEIGVPMAKLSKILMSTMTSIQISLLLPNH